MNTKEYRALLAESFVNVLQEKQLDWKKEWNGRGKNTPMNGVTNHRYKGINRFRLSMISMLRGYEDPRWCTFTQIKNEGWKLNNAKGQGLQVEYWFPYDTEERRSLTWKEFRALDEEFGEKYVLRATYKTVFNADLIEGIPPLPEPEQYDISPDILVDRLSESMGVEIINNGEDRAFYRPSEDTIHLPLPEFFYTEYAYASTALHELAHATGAAHRLNRNMSGGFGSPEYAFEELIAEISSCFMSANLHAEQTKEHIDNHKAYVQSWIKAIQENPEVLVKAVQEAEKTASYMEYKAGLIQQEEYELIAGASKEVPLEQTKVLDELSLEERYTKAMKLAGYERISEPAYSMATVAFHNSVTGDTIRVDGWEGIGECLEALKPISGREAEEFETYIHPQGRIAFYTKNLGGTGLGNDKVAKIYSDFEHAVEAYIKAETDGRELGYTINGEERRLTSFDIINMKHSYRGIVDTSSLTQNEIEEISRVLPVLEKALNRDNTYHSVYTAFGTIATNVAMSIIMQESEWGAWLGRSANMNRPQDYVDIDIAGYSTWHEIIYTVSVVHANEVVDSKSFSIKIDIEDFEQSVRKGAEEAIEKFRKYFKESVDKLETDFKAPMRIYSPYTEHKLAEHYERLELNGYESIPIYANFNATAGNKTETSEQAHNEYLQEEQVQKQKKVQKPVLSL